MIVVKFKDKEEHIDLVKKVKKMKKFTEELEDMLEDCYEDEDVDYRGGRYRRDYDEDDMRVEGRYGYRRGGGSRSGRM